MRLAARPEFFLRAMPAKTQTAKRTSVNCFMNLGHKTSRPKNDRRDSDVCSRWRKTERCWAYLKVLWKERLSSHRVAAVVLVTIRFLNQRESTRPLPR